MLRTSVLRARLGILRFLTLLPMLCVRVSQRLQSATGPACHEQVIGNLPARSDLFVVESTSLTETLHCRSNMKRVFRSSLWLQALLFFVLFYGVHQSMNLAMSVTSNQCRSDLPAPVKPPHFKPDAGANAHETWLTGRKLLQIDDGPGKFTEAFADVLPSAAVAHAVVHGG